MKEKDFINSPVIDTGLCITDISGLFTKCESITVLPKIPFYSNLTIDTNLEDSNIYYNIEPLNVYSEVI